MRGSKDGRSIHYIEVFIRLTKKIYDGYKRAVDKVNKRMEGKYSPSLIALGASILTGVIVVFMLFLPNYLGMSDDGSFSKVMNGAGISYTKETEDDVFFNYYVKQYSLSSYVNNDNSVYKAALTMVVKLAVLIDNLITHDYYFDIRFLALLYSVLFILALFMFIKQAAKRVEHFSEGVIIGIVGVVIFADVAYITYFSSFYAEPLIYISFMVCIGALLSMQNEKNEIKYLLLYTGFGTLLAAANFQCASIGGLLAAVAIKQIIIRKDFAWKAACVVSSFILMFSMFVSYQFIKSDFTKTSKYHAMTRGILLQAANPEKALEEFGISSSYTMLTDTNGYDKYPLVKSQDAVLERGFFDKYNTGDIGLYYMRHPKAMIAMLDIAVKASFDIRPSYSGNYEKSVGLPEKAKSPFWSFWSNFKINLAPKTIGFIALIFAVDLIIFRKRKTDNNKRSSIEVEAIMLILAVGITQAVIAIIYSGDTEFNRHIFLLGVTVDMLCYLTFSKMFHSINIIQTGGKTDGR